MQYRANEGIHTSDDAGYVAAEMKKKPKLARPDGETHYSTSTSPKKRKVTRLCGNIFTIACHCFIQRTAEYVPEYRSGPYAIIIALHRAQQVMWGKCLPLCCDQYIYVSILLFPVQKPTWIGYLTKAQLMTQAQPYSDKSFTIVSSKKCFFKAVCVEVAFGLIM